MWPDVSAADATNPSIETQSGNVLIKVGCCVMLIHLCDTRMQVFKNKDVVFQVGTLGTFSLREILGTLAELSESNDEQDASLTELGNRITAEMTRALAAEGSLMSSLTQEINKIKAEQLSGTAITDLQAAVATLMGLVSQLRTDLTALSTSTTTSLNKLTSDLAAVSSTVTTNTASINAMSTQVTSLLSRMMGIESATTMLQTTTNTQANSLSELRNEVDSLDTTLSASVNAHEASIGMLGTRMTAVETSTTSLQTTTSSYGTSISALQSTQTTQGSTLSSLSTTVSSHATSIMNLTTAQSNASTSLMTLSTDVGYISGCARLGYVASSSARSGSNTMGCVPAVTPSLSTGNCTSTTAGVLRYVPVSKTLEVCTGTAFQSVSSVVCRLCCCLTHCDDVVAGAWHELCASCD
jgi:hypothetical protein